MTRSSTLLAATIVAAAASSATAGAITETISGQYNRVGSCAYRALDQDSPTQVRVATLHDLMEVTRELHGVRVWRVTFEPQGPTKTVVKINSMSAFDPTKILPFIRACRS